MNSLDCSAQVIVKATVYTLLEQKREAEGVIFDMKNKNQIIIVCCIIISLIVLVIFIEMNSWKEISFSNNYVKSDEIDIDLDGDGVKENIKLLNTYGKYITINNTDYVINKTARENVNENNYNPLTDFKNFYLFMDINGDGIIEIILDNYHNEISPPSTNYTIYNFNKESLKEVGNFSVIGDKPKKINVKGNWIKFKYHPYETKEGYIETVKCKLDI